MKIIPTPKPDSYDVAVVIGRWQMPHKGHDTLFLKALALAPRVVVVVGSAFRARDTRNPFNAQERQAMILASLAPEVRERVTFIPMRDYFDDARWACEVERSVQAVAGPGARIALVGFKKDATSGYLDRFPYWRGVAVAPAVNLDATSLRNVYFSGAQWDRIVDVLRPLVSDGVLRYLELWAHLPAYSERVGEHLEVVEYRKEWTAPWYVTADALVRVADHILLVRRGGRIGYDLWALPGGFVNPFEEFLPGALRELQEETNLGFSAAKLTAALRDSAVLGHPLRSARGRLVSHAFYFAFGEGTLPEVRPSSDAKETRWVHISDLPKYEELMFEDHYMGISRLVPDLPAS